jgi:hypothetical protein
MTINGTFQLILALSLSYFNNLILNLYSFISSFGSLYLLNFQEIFHVLLIYLKIQFLLFEKLSNLNKSNL